MNSQLFKLNLTDWQKGLIIAIIGMPLSVIYASFQAGGFTFTWQDLLRGALLGGLGYLMKNLTTNSQGQWITPEPKPQGGSK